MLLRFEVANHRSILDPVELSMIAVDKDRPATRSFDLLNEQVLTVAGIYGPNASGKSNVLEALAWLSSAVERSLRSWDNAIPRDPFKFGDGPRVPSTYEVEMIADDVRYTYRLEITDSEVLSESLVSYPKRQPRTLFEREGMEISFRRGLENTSGARELLTPTTLALSAVMRFSEPEVQPLGRDLRNIMGLGVRSKSYRSLSPTTESIFREDDGTPQDVRDSAIALLRFADFGIGDVQVTVLEDSATKLSLDRASLSLLHRAAGQEIPFDLKDESAGTRTWFRLIAPALFALRKGRVLLFDEIDASLHPRLSARLLDLFQDPFTNPHGAQLIFTTHDTSLLNSLNRDEVWLTEKADNGATTLTALAEFGGDKVRRSLNLEKAYLQGRFGAVPELDQIALRRALGVASDDKS
ncbi:MAG: AAA family ATPase [Trebonia sp.]